MLFGLGSKKLLALDIGTSSIKLAEIDVGSRGARLQKFGIYPLNPGLVDGGEIVDVASVAQAVQSLVQISKTKRNLASVGMFGSSFIVKKIAMPRMEASLVAEQVKWEAEQYIPFDVNEISLEHHILNRQSGESMEVLLVAAKQEFIFRVIETLESSGLKAGVIDISGFALANCFEANYGVVQGTVALLNIGAGVSNFVVIERGEVVFCRDIQAGGNHYTFEIHKAMGISVPEAEALKISASLGQEAPEEVNTIISAANEQVIDEIRNSFEFYSATAAGSAISRLFVSGGCIFVPGLVEGIGKALGLGYEMLDPFAKVSYDPKAFTPDYIEQIKAVSPIALGLAMRKVGE